MNPRHTRLVFWYLTTVYFLAGAAETFISPLFPLLRQDLHLRVSDQAALIAALTMSIAAGNLAGGWIGDRFADRWAVRCAAISLTVGSVLSGIATSFLTIALGQVLSGLGTGLFFAPGLAIIGRMYPARLGRAVASYGLGYSTGLAAAAFASALGTNLWRAAFLATGVLALGFAVVTPRLPEAEARSAHTAGLLRSALLFVRSGPYRAALQVGIVAGLCNYLVIGLTPEHFVGQGVAAGVIGAIVGAGRLASMVGKYVSGWMLDRLGDAATVQALMAMLVLFGLAELAAPADFGMWAVVPVVCASAMLFPVSNAMVVAALPGRATWGVGVYRAVLMVCSAVCSALTGLALHVFSTRVVMIAVLLLPFIVAAAQGNPWRRLTFAASSPASAPARTNPIDQVTESS